MKIIIVGLIKGTQIQRLKEEAEKLGHTLYGCHTSDLLIESDSSSFNPSINGKPLSDFDLVYLCAGIETKLRLEWFVACNYLLNNTKTRIVNRVVAQDNYYPSQTWFYLKQFENQIPFPKTLTIYSEENLAQVSVELGFPLIVKVSETHQGKGIFLANNLEEVKIIMAENSGKAILLRKFIPNDGDIRVFTIGFKAVGAMKRTPTNDNFRSNISQGGVGENFDLEKFPEIRELAEKSAKVSGIEIAGVDIMISKNESKPYVLEVNSGPQFKGLEKYTSANIAQEIIKYFESL